MRLFLATCTVFVILTPLLKEKGRSASLTEPGRIEGVVTYDGRLPEPVPVSEAGTTRQLIEVDPETKGLRDAVVWLEGVPEPRGDQEVTRIPVVMDQQNFFFLPHVLAVRSSRRVPQQRCRESRRQGILPGVRKPGQRDDPIR
jgi:hypothetical protein